MFVGIELLSNNVMEPWLYGASTGLSTVAILISAVFWTWLWGAVGLLLATPLTVCIVVLGKYVPQLQFLDVLLGDQPALPPEVSFYQRLLAGDRREAEKAAEAVAAARGFEKVLDEVLIPAVRLARRDREYSRLTAEDESAFYDATREIVHRLAERFKSSSTVPAVLPGESAQVLACSSQHRAEELTLEMFAEVLKSHAISLELISTRTLPVEIENRVARQKPAVLFIAVMPPGGTVQARYLCRRLRKKFPALAIVVGYWGRAKISTPCSFDCDLPAQVM